MKKEVIICDGCKDNLAKLKCEVCGKDLCTGASCSFMRALVLESRSNNGLNTNIFITDNGYLLPENKFFFCKSCANLRIESDAEIRKLILVKLKKEAMVKELEGGKK